MTATDEGVCTTVKKFLTLAFLVIFGLSTFLSFAMATDMGPMSIDTVLAEIRQEQGINATDTIDVNKVSTAKLEALGDSVMELMIGNSAMHEQMDARLGGDGSANLTAFHVRLGYNYLSDYPNGMMNLMSGGMMNTYQSGMMNNYQGGLINAYPGGMMGYFAPGGLMRSFGWGGLVFCFLFLVAIVTIVILVIKIRKKPKS
jgi:hypothetical protein